MPSPRPIHRVPIHRVLIASLITLAGAPASASPFVAGRFVIAQDGDLVSDGHTAQTVAVYLPGLAADDKVRIKSHGGDVLDVSRGPLHTVLIQVVADDVARRHDVDLTVIVRGDHKSRATVPVATIPPATGVIAMLARPSPSDVGQPVQIEIALSGPAHLPPESRAFTFRASSGTLSEPEPVDDTHWRATWTPPADAKGPGIAVLTAADLSAPETVMGRLVLPITATQTLTAHGPVGSLGTLIVAGRPYGPTTVPPTGELSFDATVPPGCVNATLRLVDAEDTDTVREVPTGATSTGVLAFSGLPDGMKVPAGRDLHLWLTAIDATGHPQDSVAVAVPAAHTVVPRGDGWYEATVTTPDVAGPFVVDASVDTRATSLTLDVIAPPVGLTLGANPARLAPATPLSLTVTARDGVSEHPRGGAALTAVVNGQSQRLITRHSGTATTRVEEPGDRVSVVAIPPLTPTGLPAARLRVWTPQDAITAGTDAVIPVIVIVEDALGVPVPGQEVLLVAGGGAAIAHRVDTGVDGVGVVGVSPGLRPGLAPIVALSGPLTAGTVLWQTEGTRVIPPHLSADPDGERRQAARVPSAIYRRGEDPLVRDGTVRVPAVAEDPLFGLDDLDE